MQQGNTPEQCKTLIYHNAATIKTLLNIDNTYLSVKYFKAKLIGHLSIKLKCIRINWVAISSEVTIY